MGDSSVNTGKGLPWGPTDYRGGFSNLNPFKSKTSPDTGWDRGKTSDQNVQDVQGTPEAQAQKAQDQQADASMQSALAEEKRKASALAAQTLGEQNAQKEVGRLGDVEANALITSRRRTGRQLYGPSQGLGGF